MTDPGRIDSKVVLPTAQVKPFTRSNPIARCRSLLGAISTLGLCLQRLFDLRIRRLPKSGLFASLSPSSVDVPPSTGRGHCGPDVRRCISLDLRYAPR